MTSEPVPLCGPTAADRAAGLCGQVRRGEPRPRPGSCSSSGSGGAAAWRRAASAAASARTTSSAWQVPHTGPPAFQAVLCAVVSFQRWSVNFSPHR
ncbi:hypothetical protein [Streptomyces sp. NPDC046939]|uniref:hypothetical protein n=1 Tax=Streptomyces sp. NPDC046939 TaxID=3155376 RepID=UPI0033D7F727